MIKQTIGNAELYNGDCMEYMATLPDKAFELAIVDPPYGIGWDNENESMSGGYRKDGSQRYDKTWKTGKACVGYKKAEWDSAPDKAYSNELLRVSRNAIIWGGNYFDLPKSGGWIVWDKQVTMPSLSKGELAWTNSNEHVEIFSFLWSGYKKGEETSRIHPTQKPVALYKWLLSRYAKPGDKILDTHGGSGSSVIACLDLGFPIVWIEKDEDYYASALERIRIFNAQGKLFDEPKKEAEQGGLF